jgi:hypothetical protein
MANPMEKMSLILMIPIKNLSKNGTHSNYWLINNNNNNNKIRVVFLFLFDS